MPSPIPASFFAALSVSLGDWLQRRYGLTTAERLLAECCTLLAISRLTTSRRPAAGGGVGSDCLAAVVVPIWRAHAALLAARGSSAA